MSTILITIHIIIALGIIAVILMQRSEGGALGLGTSSMGFMSGRGAGNLLTKITALLATLFMITSILLVIITRESIQSESIIESIEELGDKSSTEIEPEIPE